MKRIVLILLAFCLCMPLFSACGIKDSRENVSYLRTTFESKEKMLSYLEGDWVYDDGFSKNIFSFSASGDLLSWYEIKGSEEKRLERSFDASEMTFIPKKGIVLFSEDSKFYVEGLSLVWQTDDYTPRGSSEIGEGFSNVYYLNVTDEWLQKNG